MGGGGEDGEGGECGEGGEGGEGGDSAIGTHNGRMVARLQRDISFHSFTSSGSPAPGTSSPPGSPAPETTGESLLGLEPTTMSAVAASSWSDWLGTWTSSEELQNLLNQLLIPLL